MNDENEDWQNFNRKHSSSSSFGTNFVTILIALVFAALIIGIMYIKVEAYGGDATCLIVRCVKVIQ